MNSIWKAKIKNNNQFPMWKILHVKYIFAMKPTPDIRIPAVPRIAESNPSVVSYLVGNPVGIRTTYHPFVHRGMAADHTVASKEEWLN